MRDLFSGCAYVRTYMLVTLRNVNLRSRSKCQFAPRPVPGTGDNLFTQVGVRSRAV